MKKPCLEDCLLIALTVIGVCMLAALIFMNWTRN
jgi:hypothetical protein